MAPGEWLSPWLEFYPGRQWWGGGDSPISCSWRLLISAQGGWPGRAVCSSSLPPIVGMIATSPQQLLQQAGFQELDFFRMLLRSAGVF